MSKFLYDLGIWLYLFMIRIAGISGNAKAKRWTNGRWQWRQRFAQDWAKINPHQSLTIWVHCASLGEFEQGRPVIETLKQQYPACKILLTFFSPSGYEIRKDYPYADYICYLPLDNKSNALAFIEIFKPHLAIFVKYEFWFHFLNSLHQKQIPTLLISAIFRKEQLFFKSYGDVFRQLLPQFAHIFVQNELSGKLLQQLNLTNFSVAGDTRVDRVSQIAAGAPVFPIVQTFAENHQILICGSTWQPDEAILIPFINHHLPAGWKVIIAPHQIGEGHLQQIEQSLQKIVLRYSQATPESGTEAQVLLIDNIGMLAALYRYGRIAYIGGGFGVGIHNTLEPIAFQLPVIFGPKYKKFEEALQLTAKGGAFSIKNLDDFQKVFESLAVDDNYRQAAAIAHTYILENRGATAKILHFITDKEWIADAS